MNAHKPIPGAPSHCGPQRSGGAVAPKASTPFPGNHPQVLAKSPDPIGGAGKPANASTICPDCDGPFSYRITDEDTRCSYPVDDGEHYCLNCDRVWVEDELIAPAPVLPAMTIEEVNERIAAVFGPKKQADGSWRVEA